MTALSAPFGLSPVGHLTGGTVRIERRYNLIPSGYAANIAYQSPVTLDTTTQKIRIAAANEDILGVFAGVGYQSSLEALYVQTKSWASGTAYIGDLTVFLWMDPQIIYEVQANGSLTITSIGDQGDLVNPGAVATGISTAGISTTLAGNGAQKQLRILDLAPRPDNAWGDAFTIVHVQIARNQLVANKTAF